MKKISFIFILLVVFCLTGFNVAFSHTLWLNATDYSPKNYSPEYGAKTIIYFGWGHRYPVADFFSVKKLRSFNLITPEGKIKELRPGKGGFLATQLSLSDKGAYIVTASLKPGFYTMYVENGKIHHKIGPKTGLDGVILSLYFEQYAKVLINAGGTDSSFSKPVGQTLEIVPLQNPIELKVGDFLPIKVLFRGKPAKFCSVLGTFAGFSSEDNFAFATVTNSEGQANIRILHYGPWMIKATIKLPAPTSLKNKCNEMSYTATLTFEVK